MKKFNIFIVLGLALGLFSWVPQVRAQEVITVCATDFVEHEEQFGENHQLGEIAIVEGVISNYHDPESGLPTPNTLFGFHIQPQGDDDLPQEGIAITSHEFPEEGDSDIGGVFTITFQVPVTLNVTDWDFDPTHGWQHRLHTFELSDGSVFQVLLDPVGNALPYDLEVVENVTSWTVNTNDSGSWMACWEYIPSEPTGISLSSFQVEEYSIWEDKIFLALAGVTIMVVLAMVLGTIIIRYANRRWHNGD